MFQATSFRVVMIAGLFALATSSSMWGQTGSDADGETAESTKPMIKEFRGRLPNYYGQIGLLPEQRKAIYAIQKKYHREIEELKLRLAALEAQEDREVYNVLDDEQKAALKALQDKRKSKSSSKAKKSEETAEEAGSES